MTSAQVWIAGGYQSDFARNVTKEGFDIGDLPGVHDVPPFALR